MPRAFKRELGLPINVNGKPIHFEPVSNRIGVILLDEANDAEKISELDRLADARKKGVVRISLEVREALIQKKTPPKTHQPNALFGNVRAFSRDKNQPSKASSPDSVGSSPASGAPAAAGKQKSPMGVPIRESVPPKPGEPVTMRPSPALVEMLKAQGKPIPPPLTVKAPPERPSPKDKANHILKTDLPKPAEAAQSSDV